jgi:KaiC/GvpD/RAD55 family RecA-like ATPase
MERTMFPQNYAVLVIGDPSAGMFEFCCYLGATYLKAGEKVVFLEANTPPDRVRKQMLEYGVDAYKHESEKTLAIIDAYTPLSEAGDDPNVLRVEGLSNLSDIFEAVTKGIEKVGGQPVKVLFDSLTPLFMHHDLNVMGRFFRDLTTMARFSGTMTALVHRNILDEDKIALLSSIADGLLEIKVDQSFRRFVRIKYLKGVLVTPKWVPFDFQREEEVEGASLIWGRP